MILETEGTDETERESGSAETERRDDGSGYRQTGRRLGNIAIDWGLTDVLSRCDYGLSGWRARG